MKTAREVIVAVLADHLAKDIADAWADGSDFEITTRRRRRAGRPSSNIHREMQIAWFIEMERRKNGMKHALHAAQEKFGLKEKRLRAIHNAHKHLFADVQ
jgi:hypothetical protein